MKLRRIWAILSFTFKESIRAKWLLFFAIVFFLLAVDVPVIINEAAKFLPAGAKPPPAITTFLSDVVTLTFPFIPLLSLSMGSTSIADEKESGTLQYVLSTPISKSEFFVGKAIGLLLATSVVVFAGLGIASVTIYYDHFRYYPPFANALVIGASLNIAMLGLGLVISSLSTRKVTALALGMLMWFLFAVLSNIEFLTFVVGIGLGPWAALPVILLDPIETATLLASMQSGGLGSSSAGLALANTVQSHAFQVLVTTLGAWIAALFLLGFYIFRHSDLA